MQHREIVLKIVAETGGPKSETLRRLEQIERQHLDAGERIRIAEVAPHATAKLMVWLPVGAILAGQLMGIDLFGALREPLGAATFLLGLLLLWLARHWMRRITSGARQGFDSQDTGLPLDLLAIALNAGVSVSQSRGLVMRHLEEAAAKPDKELQSRIDELLERARETGEAISAALRDQADEIRAENLRKQLAKIEQTTVRITLPLGLVALPAFALMTVVPSAIASLRAAS